MPFLTDHNNRKHTSIRVITDMLLALFIILVIAMTAYTYRQFAESQQSFNAVAEDVIPELANNGKVHSQLTSLAFLIASYAESDSLAQMRIRETEVEGKLLEINRILAGHKRNFSLEMAIISEEFAVLKNLTHSQLNNRIDLTKLSKDIQQSLVAYSQNYPANSAALIRIIDVFGVIQSDQLIEVRQLEKRLSENAEELTSLPISAAERTTLIAIIADYKAIIPVKLQLLIDYGRAKGQSNFIRRYVLDLAKQAEYDTYQMAEQQTLKANKFALESSKQFSIASLIYLFSFVIALGLIVYIRLRVVSRLKRLTQAINAEAAEQKLQEIGYQEDEIGHLASTILTYVDTINDQKQKLTELSFMDSLTGIANRRAFTNQVKQSISIASHNSISVSLLLIDIDCFKQYNDLYGHVKGDECLIEVARTIDTTMKRNSDFVARYGGEEFVCIVLGMSFQQTIEIAETIRKAIENKRIPHADSSVGNFVTVSIGTYAESNVNKESSERLVLCADTALYRAKTNGRNRVETFQGNR